MLNYIFRYVEEIANDSFATKKCVHVSVCVCRERVGRGGWKRRKNDRKVETKARWKGEITE